MATWIDSLLFPDDDALRLRGPAARFTSLADAWARANHDALLMWLAARFVADDRERRAVVATALSCVATCMFDMPAAFPVLDVAPVLRQWAGTGEPTDPGDSIGALHMAQAVVTCHVAIVDALRTVEQLADLRIRQPQAATIHLEIHFANFLALAVARAQAAYGARTEMLGGVRARTPEVREILRTRHRYEDERIVLVVVP